MRPSLKTLGLLTFTVGIASGCAVKKAPPEVEFLSPSSTIAVAEGQAVNLAFAVRDPAPAQGSTESGQWRIEIGPGGGATWWTASGNLSAAPTAEAISDTIQVTWQVGPLASGSTGPIQLVLSAIATDGEGQVGADFKAATQHGVALSSSGLWWAGHPAEDGFGYFNGPNGASSFSDVGPSGPHWVVHLDGQAILVTGSSALQGWPLQDGIPAAVAAWTANMPPSATVGGVRHLRRASYAHSASAWAEVSWTDRCTWHSAQGDMQRSWVLDTGETLLDAGVVGNDMVILATTDAGEFRLIRFNIETGARNEAVTWTPEASGSTGPTPLGWLLEVNGLPAALEADGTARIWDANGGATPMTTMALPGSGPVQGAGRLENGQCWTSRNTGIFMGYNAQSIGTWDTPILDVTEDRANGLWWVLSEDGDVRTWRALQTTDFTPIGSSVAAGPATRNGTVAHNRPGPP